MAVLRPGDQAPDFDVPSLLRGVRGQLRLSEQAGRSNLVLAFYPANWEAVSARQLIEYQVERDKLLERQAEVVAVSVDHILNTTAWEREIGPFDFPLVSDFWPHGEISRSYGVLRAQEPWAGASERAIFVINRERTIVFARTYAFDQAPPLQETFAALPGI